MNFYGDVMFNLNVLFGGYNFYCVYEIIFYLGVGFIYLYLKFYCEVFVMNVGIINCFCVLSVVDINIEIGGMLVEDKFDGEIGGKYGYDGVVSLIVGLIYCFLVCGFVCLML